RMKLLGLAGLLLGFMAVVGVLAVVSLGQVNSRGASMYTNQTVPAQKLGDVSTAVVDAHRSLLRQLLYTGDAGVAAQEEAARSKADRPAPADLAAISANATATERAELDHFQTIWTQYRALRDKGLAQAKAGDNAGMRVTVKQALAVNKAARASLK